MLTLEKAILFVTEAHMGQKDKAGLPYILHPLHIMMQMGTDTERIIAVLHDVLEDTDHTVDDLIALGITEDMEIALHALNKNNFDTYMDMIRYCKLYPMARKVKIADLEHNMDLKRVLGREKMTEDDKERMAKYFAAWTYLKGE